MVKKERQITRVLIVIPPLVNSDTNKKHVSNQPDFESYRLVSPIEPASVAANLLELGFEVELFDLGIHMSQRFEKLAQRIDSFKPDAVVAVQSILTFATAQDWDGKTIFDLTRQYSPGAVTILTGSHATNYPGQAVEAGGCDYSIKGEVDFATGQLLLALNNGDDVVGVPGVSFRRSDGAVNIAQNYAAVDVNLLPVPAYHKLDEEHRRQYTNILEFGKIRFPARSSNYRDVMTSRSCVLRCSFCSVAYLRGEKQKYRRKPIDNVIAEIESALADEVEEIHFFDDLFAQNEAQILTFTNELARRNLKFHWFVAQGIPLWPLNPTTLQAMKETGMYRVICPLESGSDRVLKKVIGKTFSTVEHHHNVITWAKALGLEIIGMFVVGLPGENRSEILETVRFAQAHPEIDYSVFSIATPMVGTRLMKQVVEQKRLDDQQKINRIIKRTVALYHTEAFEAYEMGVIRTFDWDRINFSTPARRQKYAGMVGITLDQLELMRQHSKQVFYRYFPDYDGPQSFEELFEQPGLFKAYKPMLPEGNY